MESNDLDDQVRNTQPDVEPIDIEHLLADNAQRAVNFLTAGTQEDKQRFIDLWNIGRNILCEMGLGLIIHDELISYPSTDY